jgi:ABC-type polysaccharide/polyol phosphate transport system ATPase subunit
MTARLTVTNLSKKFCRDARTAAGYALRDIGGELAGRDGRQAALRAGEFWSLDDVSFELAAGEALAVLGANGAGKTTLLRIVAGLLKPDAGEVKVRGRLSALVELGAGLNPLLTARENIEIAAVVQGIGGAGLSSFMDQVVDFSELSEALDAPAQSYSTGMRARLAYALATQIDPDILLVDEVLAVGDLAFQRKCFQHLHGFLNRGGALLFVSHNPYQTQAICRRGLLLDRGRMVFEGSAVEAVHQVLERGRRAEQAGEDRAIGPVRIHEAVIAAADGGPVSGRGAVRLTLHCTVDAAIETVWGFSIWSPDNTVCIASAYDMRPRALSPGPVELSCTLADPRLAGGRYRLRAMVVERETLQPVALHGHERIVAFDVPTSPDLVRNAQLSDGQLIEVDVAWD